MEKQTKVCLGIGALVGVGVFVYSLFKSSKKEVEEEIKKEDEVLKKAGIDPEKTISKKGDFFTKKIDNFVEDTLYTLIQNMDKDNWDDDVLKTIDYEIHDQTMWGSLRVMQRDEDTVSVFIQIPPYLRTRSGSEYKTLKQYKEDILGAVRGFLNNNTEIKDFKWSYKGYYDKVSETEIGEDGDNKVISVEIPEEEALEFSNFDNYSDGLSRMMSYYYESNAERLKAEEHLLSVNMFIELNFPVVKYPGDKAGMDKISLISLLKMLTYELNIMERSYEAGDVFPEIVFFPGKNSFDTYFHVTEGNAGNVNGYKESILAYSYTNNRGENIYKSYKVEENNQEA